MGIVARAESRAEGAQRLVVRAFGRGAPYEFAGTVAHEFSHFLAGALGHTRLSERGVHRVREIVQGVEHRPVHVEYGKLISHECLRRDYITIRPRLHALSLSA